MPKDKRIIKYGSVYIPEEKPKSSAKRGEAKDGGRMQEMEDAIRALQDVLSKNNRDNLDAMYNIDTDNLSSSFRRLLSSYDDGITKAQADIQTWANAQEAGFFAIAKWQGETSASVAAIQGKADANAASITSITKWQSSVSSSIAAVQSTASQNEAKITSITKWQGLVEEDIEGLVSSVAVIEQVADENGASISQIVSAVGDDGEVTAASIVAAVNDSGSRVMINADKIEMTGDVTFLTAEDVGDDGTTEIAGNRISLLLNNGLDDDGYSDLESDNGIKFTYRRSSSRYSDLGWVYSSIDGNDSDVTSRYALNIETFSMINFDGDYVYPAIKINSSGRGSFEARRLYFNASDSEEGYIELDSYENVRIYANRRFSALNTPANYGYCFCTDGIYYNGELMIETP